MLRECYGHEFVLLVLQTPPSLPAHCDHFSFTLLVLCLVTDDEGEVLWSGRYDSNGVNRTLTDASIRLQEFRERMVVRGVEAEPFTQQWCVQRPGQCSFPGGGP